MTAPIEEPETQRLLSLLSRLPTSQLVLAISQQPALTHLISNTLQNLAAASLRVKIPDKNFEQANLIADLARRLIARGDPSLVKRLLPNQSSLIDLAICTEAKDVLARLLDDTAAEDCIQAAIIAFQKASNAESSSIGEKVQKISRAAKALAKVVSSMPRRKAVEDKLTKAQKDRKREVVKNYHKALHNLSSVYDSMSLTQAEGHINEEHLLLCKVALLDAAYFIIERLLSQASSPNIREVSNDLLASIQGKQNVSHSGSEALTDLSIIADLLLIRPGLMNQIETGNSQPSFALYSAIKNQVNHVKSQGLGNNPLKASDTAWSRVITSMSIQDDAAISSDDIVDSVLSILPHLAAQREELTRRLQTSKFAGRSAEDIISLLLQEEEEGVAFPDDEEGAATEEMESLQLLQERANIFNNEPLQPLKVTRGKASDRTTTAFELSSGLSEEMRAAIIARAEVQDLDEEEEWNPFSKNAFEIGFEEEMELEPEPVGNARLAIRDGSDDEDLEEEAEEGEGDGSRGAAGHGSGAGSERNSIAAERAAERVLISAWSEKGEAFFKKEARKSSGRLELVKKLNDLPGRKWDDGLVESWATMFARNPRKDKLLSSVDDIMRVGNTNQITNEDSAFGPNRGRGGRILTGDRGSSRGARGRGHSRGRGSRGGAAKRARGGA